MRRTAWLAMTIAAVLLSGCPSGGSGDPNDSTGEPPDPDEVAIPNEGAQHVQVGVQVSYRANPPASGPHWPTPTAAGFYDAPVEEEGWVHSLEHGYVVILYDCGGPCDEALLDKLRNLLTIAPRSATFGTVKLVIAPYDGLPGGALLTLVAWDVQLSLDAYDESRILGFYNRYLDEGPELAP